MDLFCAVLRDPWEIIYKVSGMIMGLLRRTAGAVHLAMTVSLIESGGRFAGKRSDAVSLLSEAKQPL